MLEVERAIQKQRAKLGGSQKSLNSEAAVRKHAAGLENRLDKALIKFNRALDVNAKLRDQIDNLRRERAVFDITYHRLEKELLERKKQIAEVIEASSSAYEARSDMILKVVFM